MDSSGQKPPSYDKAGLLLHGEINGERYVIAPYNEGRFANGGHKYYVLPKGSIDQGEDLLAAAMRECKEETGIDAEKLLGPKVIERLRHGETVENVPSGFAGVTIKRVSPECIDYHYTGQTGTPNRFRMFTIELEGMQYLYDKLKNPLNRNTGQTAYKTRGRSKDYRVEHTQQTVSELTKDTLSYPTLADCLTWLRDMRMPPRKWNIQLNDMPALKAVGNAEGADHWFRRLEKKYNHGRKVKDLKTWRAFCDKIPADDLATLCKFADEMKVDLVKLGLIGDDNKRVKFDTKDCPFNFYQEGADLLRADEYMAKCIEGERINPYYARAFFSKLPESIVGKQSRMDRIESSQMAGVVWAVPKEDIARAVKDRSLRRDLMQIHDNIDATRRPFVTMVGGESAAAQIG